MHVDSETLLARIQADYPLDYELSMYRCLVGQYEDENARLREELENRDHGGTPLAGNLPPGYEALSPDMPPQPFRAEP